jgi:hypothetical protein
MFKTRRNQYEIISVALFHEIIFKEVQRGSNVEIGPKTPNYHPEKKWI